MVAVLHMTDRLCSTQGSDVSVTYGPTLPLMALSLNSWTSLPCSFFVVCALLDISFDLIFAGYSRYICLQETVMEKTLEKVELIIVNEKIIIPCFPRKCRAFVFVLKWIWALGGLFLNCFLVTEQNFCKDLLFLFQLCKWLIEIIIPSANIMQRILMLLSTPWWSIASLSETDWSAF